MNVCLHAVGTITVLFVCSVLELSFGPNPAKREFRIVLFLELSNGPNPPKREFRIWSLRFRVLG